MIFEVPEPTRGEIHFRLFDIPVRVHPYFWLTTLFMGLSPDVGTLLIWVGVVFVSILWHELGHVFAYRFFGIRGDVVYADSAASRCRIGKFEGLSRAWSLQPSGHCAEFLIAASGVRVSVEFFMKTTTMRRWSCRDLMWVNGCLRAHLGESAAHLSSRWRPGRASVVRKAHRGARTPAVTHRFSSGRSKFSIRS